MKSKYIIFVKITLVNLFLVLGLLGISRLYLGNQMGLYAVLILISIQGIFYIIFKKAVANPQVKRPLGMAVTLEDLPIIDEIIEEVTQKMAINKPTDLFLTHDPNAKILLNAPYGRQKDTSYTLYLGLPLIMILTKDELASVLAHEFAHGSESQVKAKLRLLKSRHEWVSFRRLLSTMPIPFKGLKSNIEDVLVGIDMGVFQMNYANEFVSDALAVEVTNPDVVASALLKVKFYTEVLNTQFWKELYLKYQAYPLPPEDLYKDMAIFLKKDFSNEWRAFSLTLAGEINFPNDEHPRILDRIDQVKGHVPDALNGLSIYHGDETHTLEAIIKSASENWTSLIKEAWRKRFESYHDLTMRFNQTKIQLESEPENTMLYIEVSQYYEYVFQYVEAFHAVKKAFDLKPDSYINQFHMGRFLLNRELHLGVERQVEGLILLEMLLEVSPQWAYASAIQLFHHHTEDGQFDKALYYLKIAQCIVFQMDIGWDDIEVSTYHFKQVKYPMTFRKYLKEQLEGLELNVRKLYCVAAEYTINGKGHSSDLYFVEWASNKEALKALESLKTLIGCPVKVLDASIELRLLGIQGSRII